MGKKRTGGNNDREIGRRVKDEEKGGTEKVGEGGKGKEGGGREEGRGNGLNPHQT